MLQCTTKPGYLQPSFRGLQKVKILLYGLNYAPEQTGIGKYTGELGQWLAADHNEVRVITAPPYYPAWKVQLPYKSWWGRKETISGVRVWRSPLWVPSSPSGAKRVLHLLSFALGSAPALLRQLAWGPDVVVVIAPALVCAPGGLLTAKLTGARTWLHVQDFEVDAAFQMGLLKGSAMKSLVGRFERWVLRQFDRVSTISPSMLALLRAKGVDDARVVSFPNWVDTQAIAPLTKPSTYRAELGIRENAVVALYSGSMAGKQGLDLLPAAARALQTRLPELVIVLCGDGVYRPSLERDCAGLTNVRLLPLQPASRLGELLGMADIHLLPQQAQAADLVMPSKLTGMLASGRPTLTTASPGSELARVVRGRGLVVAPGDAAAFQAGLVKLTEDPGLRRQLGTAARSYASTTLARDAILAKFALDLHRCLRAKGGMLGDPTALPSQSATVVAADEQTRPT